ncbi:FAD:protein FMN transferase [Gemella cuniculi]|uniref:FAD:protein FMN transferase n=1 Tax=Gemella cuniculi TaxID=150240 RepID=UPI00040B7CEA|nr:FAD:protein FMN transferase [Gemella cuniculi]
MKLKTKSIRLMGAAIDIAIYHKENAEIILEKVVDLLCLYEHRFSANDDSSELMEINHNAGIKELNVSPDLYNLIKLAKKHSDEKNSFFNVAIGPIIQCWKIGFLDAKVPTSEEINNLLKITNPKDIILNDKKESVYLLRKGMQINLGAIAKGYIADLIIDYLKSVGVKSGFINLGGNFLTFGEALHSEDKYWRVGIQDPNLSRGNYVCVLKVKNKSVVTSGIYERILKKDGKVYHHILNPKTGYPIESEVAGLTIISNSSVDGEIWTTKLFGRDIEDVMDEIEDNEDIEGIVITKKGEIYFSSGLENNII